MSKAQGILARFGANLDESIEFQVLFYNQEVQPLAVRDSQGLIRASQVNKNRANRSQNRRVVIKVLA